MPKWDQYADEYERDNYRESKRSKVRKPKKLNYKQILINQLLNVSNI